MVSLSLEVGQLRWCPTEPGSNERLANFPEMDDRRYLHTLFRRDTIDHRLKNSHILVATTFSCEACAGKSLRPRQPSIDKNSSISYQPSLQRLKIGHVPNRGELFHAHHGNKEGPAALFGIALLAADLRASRGRYAQRRRGLDPTIAH